MPLESIGSYRLIELLGAGAMGEVYKATDGKMFDRVVALKLLNEKFARNENARSRFQNEVQYVAHLDHPNIVKIYDHGEVDGRPYFVMEFLDGIDLAGFMKDEANRNVERCVEIARQLCEALDFAHRHNVVHRDIKPANVMIVRRGGSEQVKLVDFGIIHVDASKMTRDGTQPGTSAYSSPEQLRNDPVDHRSDLFSLGIVLYELFANAYPFDAPSEALITHHILQREPEPPRKRNATIPAAVDVLIMKLLEKDPAQRPQTAGEVAEALRQQHRKLQSRWASTDPAEYENLDEITREAVDKLVAWARQKEADGALQEAVDAYEKALKLAPESERIQRRIPKLKHRIESERLLKEHLAQATAALASGHFPEAREHWKHAWILSPESEDVAALQLRIESTEQAVPDDRERRRFVEGLIARAEEALDAGRLDQARAEVVQLLQRYPKDPLANFMLDRILSILMAGVDYAAYRKSIREARDLIDDGRFSDARARCAAAQALWPGDEEAASVERDIDQRVEGEVATLAARVEKNLLRADDPEIDDKAGLELLAAVREDVAKARALDAGSAWIRSSSDDADRIERSIDDRVARAEAFRKEQEDQRRKRVDMFLQRGRNQMAEADVLAGRVTTEPGPAIELYGVARESFERVLHDDTTEAEALDARRRIDEQLRNLAERVDREREKERELTSALEAARVAVAETEIAGGARAGDLGAIAALLHEADVALDRVLVIDPKYSDAVPLRARVGSLRAEVVREQERRDAQAGAALREAEQAERRRVEEERGRVEDARRAAEDAENKRREDERRAVEQAERDRKAEEKRAAEEARRQAAENLATAASPAPQVAADSRKIAEFEKGLAKHRRLVQQGRAREASDIERILRSEAASDPQLKELYTGAFPDAPDGGSPRWLLWGAIAGAVAVGIAVTWFVAGGGPEESQAPAPAPPLVQEAPAEPFQPPVEPPAANAVSTSVPPAAKPDASAPEPVTEPIPAPIKPPAKPEATASASGARVQKPVQKPITPSTPAAATPHPPGAASARTGRAVDAAGGTAATQDPARGIPEGMGRIRACLTTAAGGPAGAGYRLVFSIDARAERETPPTGANGCASLDVEIRGSAKVQSVYAKGPRAEPIEVEHAPSRKLFQGTVQSIEVRMKM